MNDLCDLYLVGYEHATFGYAVKVGVASNAGARLASLQTASPEKINLYFSFRFPSRSLAMEVERRFHQSEIGSPIRGEWCATPDPYETLLILTYFAAETLSKHIPKEVIAQVRRDSRLNAAFEYTDRLSGEQQEKINKLWHSASGLEGRPI